MGKNEDIWNKLRAGPLYFYVESNQLRWFSIGSGSLLDIFWACPTGRRRWADPEQAGGITIPIWLGNTSESPKEDPEMWVREKEVVTTLLPKIG